VVLHDSLTELPNRTFLIKRLEEVLKQQQMYPNAKFALFYLDCDGYKNINDSFGYAVGDQLLISICQRLKLAIRQNDFIARLGDDEFVILLPNIENSHVPLKVAERIFENFRTKFFIQNRDFVISFSLGILVDLSPYKTANDILRDADKALLQAKYLGKDRYQVYKPSCY